MMYSVLADALAAFHFSYVAFVVAGELAILVGAAFGCRWARNPWFRSLHLLAIAVVAMEAVWHIDCPLTTWENQLRAAAGQATSNETFVGRLVQLVFLNNLWDQWVYEYLHIGFGILVLLTYVLIPPRFRRTPRSTAAAVSPSGSAGTAINGVRIRDACQQGAVANRLRP
jgi:hypothetical protein